MPQRQATLRSQWLGRQLRDMREENQLSLSEAGRHIHRDHSQLSRMENGILPVPEADLTALMDLYGVSDPSRRDALLRLARDVWRTDWWVGTGEDFSETFIDYVWLERRAETIQTLSATVLEGLLQTPAYARAIITARNPEDSPEQIERWIEVRMTRQVLLNRADPPHLSVMLDEGMLRREVGTPAVMAAQLRYVIEAAERPNIDIHVLPFAAGGHANMQGNFRLLLMPEPFSEVVCVESESGLTYLEPPKSTRYVADYERLLDNPAVLGGDQSLAFVKEIADEMERK